MTQRSVTHSTFVLERIYEAPPARVFAAWADPAIKAQWFGGGPEEWESGEHTLDFRVGGRESSAGRIEGGPSYTYDALYQDIVRDERIVSTYDMTLNGERISVSVATVEFAPEGSGTRLTLTEQGAFLDGLDKVEDREHGTRELLDKLAEVVARETANA
jgi:uncharacterized protein YndB with AHSA1/START domain